MKLINLLILFSLITACNHLSTHTSFGIIAQGNMPNITKDNSDNLQLVFGEGDSIMYAYSSDHGKTFSSPSLVSVLPKLAASHTRGPQLAVTKNNLVLTACNEPGDIFSYIKDASGRWQLTGRVNDIDTVAKENLMALGADGLNAFAVWLDLRDKHNKIFGAKSADGGKTWSKNIMIYASPDTTVCECCKPSVIVRGNHVYITFRNWINGNRDLYLIESSNNGESFGVAQKLGKGSWRMKGCPMDGGGLAINSHGALQTVWNRKGVIYACEPGKNEQELGEGRNCTMESVNGKNVYAWVENGEVVVMKPMGMKKILGKGQLPVLKAINNEHVICVWESDKKIYKAILEL